MNSNDGRNALIRLAIIIGSSLFGLFMLWFILTQPQGEDLPFETMAQGEVINYKQEKPDLIIFAKTDEVDKFSPSLFTADPQLVTRLRNLDYDRFFAILVLQGQKGSTRYSATVRQVRRQGTQVIVKAEFVEPKPETLVGWLVTAPYHLVFVSKQGTWGRPIQFLLFANDKKVAETAHNIP